VLVVDDILEASVARHDDDIAVLLEGASIALVSGFRQLDVALRCLISAITLPRTASCTHWDRDDRRSWDVRELASRA
jgi:hypothetical protein